MNFQQTVTTTDKGLISKSSSVQVRIIVSDENDNSPIFYPKIYYVALPNVARRNAPPVTTVKDFDADADGTNSKVTFKIENSEEIPGAKIDEESGQVFLERFVQAEKVLKISASDGGGRKSRYVRILCFKFDDKIYLPI